MTTILPASISFLIRQFSIPLILALLWAESLLMPACHPVRETAGQPKLFRVKARRAADCCSPVASNISISRPFKNSPVAPANWIRSSVVSPMADTTTTTCCPFIFISRTRQAIFLIFSIEATELPPNFATTNDKLLTPWIISHLLLNNNALPAYPA
jgi:hypothetical protein